MPGFTPRVAPGEHRLLAASQTHRAEAGHPASAFFMVWTPIGLRTGPRAGYAKVAHLEFTHC
jgi:hypothetical protein